MTYLLLILHLFIGATLAGVFLVVVLVAGLTSGGLITAAVIGGFVLAFPVAFYVERALRGP